jgi:hypothetical protein
MATDTTIQTGLTRIGQSILTQAQLGKSITFTKVKIGDGELGSLDPADLTDLINPLQELGIYDKDSIDEQTMSITALITQSETGYTFREIGLFAIEPNTGLEVLYAYGNKGDVATYIPSNTSSIAIEEEATIIVEVANASNVIVNISREYAAKGQGIPPSVCTNLNITEDGNIRKLTWNDPKNTIIDMFTLCTWAGTQIRKKFGSYPKSETDGELVADITVWGTHSTEPLIDENGEGYYYKAFPYSTHDVFCRNSQNEFGIKVYEFTIDDNDSNPSTCVKYLGENTDFTSAYMNTTTKKFEWGSWESAFFMGLMKPCMLKRDGSVDYYLYPNDLGLREDGITASDNKNANYDGNAMLQVGQIWIKEEQIGSLKHICIANKQVDENYDCWTHKRADGSYTEFYYRALYNGSLIDNIIRSLSGKEECRNVAGNLQLQYAKANGNGYRADEYNFRRLINYLLILMGKSLDMQSTFGTGRYTGYKDANNTGQILITGTNDKKGPFYCCGDNERVTVFWMEDWWGEIWKFTEGIIQKNGKLLYKMCLGTDDGSTVEDYNIDGTGYIDSGVTLSGTISQLYIKTMKLVPHIGLVPTADAGGSSSTSYCDGMWSNSSVAGFARFGGDPYDGLLVGPFSFNVDLAVSHSNWHYGVALSYREPL